MFYDNLLKLCSSHKTSPTAVAKAIGLSGAAATGWKKGKEPFPVTLQKVADYFGVSVEELQKEKPAHDVDEPNREKLLKVVQDSEDREFLLSVLNEVNRKLQEMK